MAIVAHASTAEGYGHKLYTSGTLTAATADTTAQIARENFSRAWFQVTASTSSPTFTVTGSVDGTTYHTIATGAAFHAVPTTTAPGWLMLLPPYFKVVIGGTGTATVKISLLKESVQAGAR